MSPRPTTIVLNSELNHSIRYDPSDDSVTALLPRPITIEHVRNKAKLMLLIYFVQRDQQRKSSPRKIDADVSVELRIVERIINQFSNYAQALRTLTEYTVLGDTVDTRTGLANTRDRSDPSKTIAITMTVTPEIKQTIKEWLRDILGGQREAKPLQTPKGDITMRKRKPELIEISSASVSDNGDEPHAIEPHLKRQRAVSNGPRNPHVLTPGSAPRQSSTPPMPPSSVGAYTKLFPSSPTRDPAASTKVSEIEDTSKMPSENSFPGRTPPAAILDDDLSELLDMTVTRGQSLEASEMNVHTFKDKVKFYSSQLYKYARREEGKDATFAVMKIRKYTRKLKRLVAGYEPTED